MASGNNGLEAAQLATLSSIQRLGKKTALVLNTESKRDHRRKVVSGAGILAMLRADPSLRARFTAFMQKFATREADREALELDEPEDFYARDARESVEQAARKAEEARRKAAKAKERPSESAKGSRQGAEDDGFEKEFSALTASSTGGGLSPGLSAVPDLGASGASTNGASRSGGAASGGARVVGKSG